MVCSSTFAELHFRVFWIQIKDLCLFKRSGCTMAAAEAAKVAQRCQDAKETGNVGEFSRS